ncbi:MAG: Glycosyl transferase family 2 [Candidatus Woesebacteria bacterium GW2011_GWB1_38_5b]|uniref:Glycosyl transferase family 2 n=1 Tax=Candidatus Woesebacteria bacterium GW2011_GWB1_38_5b TaxID=1618569 RepID=A0A0G0NF86_9BACT|nr:MAG: Glycosyl transferase family 2 [Candidatus Woesebacteria bacterium GW2011_GWB1_38_5b]
MSRNKIFIVISSYNEGKYINSVLESVKFVKLPVVLVDDGSKDDTSKIAGNISGVTVIQHKVNLGKGAAMKTGCDYAFSRGAEAVIFMDADGQHSPEDISKFVGALDKGYDVVFGSRDYGYATPFVRYMGNKVASVLVSLLYGIYVNDLLCGFRGLTKNAYKKIMWESRGYGVETEMVIKTAVAKLKHCQVSVAAIYLDEVKGVTILDAFGVLVDVFRWKMQK